MPADRGTGGGKRRGAENRTDAMADEGDAKGFDEGMAELEALVRRLEAGELPLEEALAAFEAGIALVRSLNRRLTDAETRIEVLTRDAEGSVQLQPLPGEPGTKA